MHPRLALAGLITISIAYGSAAAQAESPTADHRARATEPSGAGNATGTTTGVGGPTGTMNALGNGTTTGAGMTGTGMPGQGNLPAQAPGGASPSGNRVPGTTNAPERANASQQSLDQIGGGERAASGR